MSKFYKIFFSIVLLFVIYKLYNIKIDINIIKNLKINSLIIYLFFFILSISIISIRWLILIKEVYKITLVQSLKISFLSFSLNTVSLTGSGDLFKIFLWNKKIDKNKLFNFIIVEKIFGFLNFLLLLKIFILNYIFKLSLLNIFIIVIIYLIFIYYLAYNIFFLKKIPYINYYEYFFKNTILMNVKKLIIIFFLSFTIQVCYFANLYIFSLLNYENLINAYSLLYFSIISLANSIPLFFSGFGIRELFTGIFVDYYKFDSNIYFQFILTIGLLNIFIALLILFLRFTIKSSFFRNFYYIRKYISK